MKILALLIVFGTWQGHVQHVDLIEVNHLYDSRGNCCFTQVIFWDFDPFMRLVVREWRMLDEEYPVHTVGGRTRCRTSSNAIVESSLFRESWTHHDPERENLSRVKIEDRRPLAKPAH